jgi:hypothetical protein
VKLVAIFYFQSGSGQLKLLITQYSIPKTQYQIEHSKSYIDIKAKIYTCFKVTAADGIAEADRVEVYFC